ncbi:aromatic ring-hydroxylating oxygenase subunit alpha [Minwuia sp.]|uniref:aromatic ring-hydroxylating oxygenase subunit alpha n=1 Tax=Minwuia sp. TaxID=2493630 RepID=UPI003A907EFF
MGKLLSSDDLIDRIFSHIDGKSTDAGGDVWREPVENYASEERFAAEVEVMRRIPVPFCPSSALPANGTYIARTAALTPLLLVRGDDGVVRGFRNACRHRGMPVAEGSGETRSFQCRYHAWTYGLDGGLKHVPGEAEGFPGLDKSCHGLTPVHEVTEQGGLIFVTQDEPISDGALLDMPEMLSPEQELFNTIEFTDEANWKLIGETSMEGYHIKALHNKSFYPYGFDNLNVVETYGRNSRIVFPFRRIEKLRDVPREERRLRGMITDTYQLFPNTHISVLSDHAMLIILDPVTPTETNWIIYQVSPKTEPGQTVDIEKMKRDANFVQDTGLIEDRWAAKGINDHLKSGGNTHHTFGRFEQAIGHFHKHLTAHVEMLEG